MGSTPRSIQSLLHAASPEFADILGRVRFLGRIRDAVAEALPPQAAGQIEIAGYERYRLRLHVANGAWATRLRYTQELIAQALARRMQLHVEGVDIRVRPGSFAPRPAPRQPRPMSAGSRAHIRRTAGFIDDPDLAGALDRLASAGESRDAEAR